MLGILSDENVESINNNNINTNNDNMPPVTAQPLELSGAGSAGLTSLSEKPTLFQELWTSTNLIFQGRLTWLLILGPMAMVGDLTGSLGPAICFAFSGLALVPCAERLSFITEQVAEHTNGTIGALLNASFGNAPELLISISALRAGFYRVVQLAMLGSMLTNMLLVFGVSCVIGGVRWQVQTLRITSGNVSMVMLYVATAGSLFPAALILSGQLPPHESGFDITVVPTQEEITFCRVNAFVMLFMYLCYLVFQLGTHKEEFDDEVVGSQARRARRNLFCLKSLGHAHSAVSGETIDCASPHSGPMPRKSKTSDDCFVGNDSDSSEDERRAFSTDEGEMLLSGDEEHWLSGDDEHWIANEEARRRRLRRKSPKNGLQQTRVKVTKAIHQMPSRALRGKQMSKDSDRDLRLQIGSDDDSVDRPVHHIDGPLISMRCGVVWLMVITLCISAMSDILVATIDGFARSMHISEVFTSMVILPFFSNIAEQVSAFIFAYKNEMDLVVGVTVGSAIQIATFVLPGSVIIGMMMDRSMTLFFHGYETVCLLFATVVTGAVLQGGTTNWAVGIMLVGIYVMMAAGIWFHTLEDLTIDAEILIRNVTST